MTNTYTSDEIQGILLEVGLTAQDAVLYTAEAEWMMDMAETDVFTEEQLVQFLIGSAGLTESDANHYVS